MTVEYTQDWTSALQQTLLSTLLPWKGQKLDYLEIGVYEGRGILCAFEYLLTHPESTYTGIDKWNVDEQEQRAKESIASLPVPNKAKLVKGSSHQHLPLLGEFDVIYIDGDHSMTGCLADSVIGWDHLVNGGIMFWDDCRHTKFPGVYQAINYFLKVVNYRLLQIGNQIVVQKT